MKLLLAILLTAILYSCHTSRRDEFKKYLNSIETLSVPLRLDQELNRLRSKSFDSVLFAKYVHKNKPNEWLRPHGKLFENDSIVLVIDGNGSDLMNPYGREHFQLYDPLFITFDQEGHKLDSLIPYSHFAQSEYGYNCTEFVTITPAKEIMIIDSVTLSAFDRKQNIIKGSAKLTVDTVIYKIDKAGKFKIAKGLLKQELQRVELGHGKYRLKMRRG